MRRRRAPKRPVMPDPVYNSEVVTKFINKVMWDGKKTLAERIVYGAIERLDSKEEGTKGIDIFFKAIENVKPLLELHIKYLWKLDQKDNKLFQLDGLLMQQEIEMKEQW